MANSLTIGAHQDHRIIFSNDWNPFSAILTIIANEYEVEEFSKKNCEKNGTKFFGHDFLLRVGTKYFFFKKDQKTGQVGLP